jgi:hypothetical protein
MPNSKKWGRQGRDDAESQMIGRMQWHRAGGFIELVSLQKRVSIGIQS